MPDYTKKIPCTSLKQPMQQLITRNKNIMKKQQACKPGSVAEKSSARLSLICDLCHHKPYSNLPPGIGRAALNHRYTWSCNIWCVVPYPSLDRR